MLKPKTDTKKETKCTCEYISNTCPYYVRGTKECKVKLGQAR